MLTTHKTLKTCYRHTHLNYHVTFGWGVTQPFQLRKAATLTSSEHRMPAAKHMTNHFTLVL